jgi:hypothetical protein
MMPLISSRSWIMAVTAIFLAAVPISKGWGGTDAATPDQVLAFQGDVEGLQGEEVKAVEVPVYLYSIAIRLVVLSYSAILTLRRDERPASSSSSRFGVLKKDSGDGGTLIRRRAGNPGFPGS